MNGPLDVSTGMETDLHSVCLIIIAVPIISAYLESGVEMIPYMTRHNASCIITKVCVCNFGLHMTLVFFLLYF